jgi:hypothetical protein
MKWSAFRAFDWAQFCELVESRPNVYGWTYGGAENRHDGWSGTETHAENVRLLRQGWPDGTARILQGVATLSATQDDWSPQWAMDVCGAFPDVGAYLAGEVEHMHSPDLDQPAAPPLRLYVNGSYSHKITTRQIENFGIALLTMIDALEREGRQIELVWHMTAGAVKPKRKGSKTLVWQNIPPFTAQTTLKQAGEHMDLDRMAYALAHPSMLRRSAFAIMEQFPEYAPLGDYFGAPTDYPSEAKTEDCVYLPRLSVDMYDLSTPATALAAVQAFFRI